MLLPDNIHPENSIYFNGALVLEELKKNPIQDLLELFENVRLNRKMSFPIFILSLDWLYLIEIAELNQNGEIKLCF